MKCDCGCEFDPVVEYDHRLACGDCTDPEVVARLMGNEKAGLCFTSPPYSIQRNYQDGASAHIKEWDHLMQGAFSCLPMTGDGQVVVNLGLIYRDSEWVSYWDEWLKWMNQQGWRRAGWYVWDQGSGLPGNWFGRFAPSHEFLFHFNKERVDPIKTKEKKPENICVNHSVGLRSKQGEMTSKTSPHLGLQSHKIPDSVIRVYRKMEGGAIQHLHPAIFPVALPSEFISCWGGIVYEPFSGSGTTIIACEQLGRKCRAVEISPAYCAVALQRFLDATGIRPEKID